MLGYIRISKPELKIKEYELYKAVYCSLCRKLGKSYGILSRLTLSYDFTFLALLSMALNDENICFEKKRCAFNPLKKCNYCKQSTMLEMPSAAAMIMLHYKIKDNVADEKGLKKLGWWLLSPIFSGAHKRAAKAYPEIEAAVAGYISNQGKLEAEKCQSLDMAADPTAKIMGEILMLCSDNESQKRILNRLGYCIGRYIYLLDAACDLEADIKKNRYNVLSFETGNNPKQSALERIEPQLYFCINEAVRAFELLDIKKYKTILGNIIYLGLEDTFKKEFE